jgi:phosphatidyl-myo-inositol dimannoside synthase
VPRALFLTPDFPPAPGGIQVLMHRLASHVEGVEVRVVTRACAGAREFDAQERLDVRRTGSAAAPRRANLLLNARAVREAAAFRPAVVLSGHIVTSPAARVIATALGAPTVQYLHADEIRGRPRLASFAVRRAAAVVAVSGYTRGLAERLGADPERVHTIPNGVDAPGGRAAERASRPTVVTVARLEQRYKGHDVILRALPLIRERVPEAEWVVVGDGALRPELERLVAERGLGGAVRFLGRVTDAERDAALDRGHVFAMPSRLPPEGTGGEGFGIAYLEAAARGLPVVAGAAGGAEDAVVHGETGLLVNPTDHAAVAAAISELLLDHELAERLGRAGATRARDFAWPAVARQVEDLLVSVARKAR